MKKAIHSHSSRFWKIISFFSLLLIPTGLLSIWLEGEIKSFFEVISIIILILILFSLLQKQVIALAINPDSQEVNLKIYYPFRKTQMRSVSWDTLSMKYGKEHIARGKYASVIRLRNNVNEEEYKLSAQLFWWDDSVLDQIVSELNELGKTSSME